MIYIFKFSEELRARSIILENFKIAKFSAKRSQY